MILNMVFLEYIIVILVKTNIPKADLMNPLEFQKSELERRLDNMPEVRKYPQMKGQM